jgi:hypothetical protein
MFKKEIEEIITHLIMMQHMIDTWDEYETNITRSFNSVDFRKVIQNYKPCLCFNKLYINNFDMSGILYENIVLNNNLFIDLMENGSKYPRKECEFTSNDVWALIEQCVHILVEKQLCESM